MTGAVLAASVSRGGLIKGRLAAEKLAAIRTAFLRATSEGFESAACREGKKLDEIVISNGGTPILVATSGIGSLSAPDDLTCWSKAATDLQHLLDDAFSAYHQR